MKSVILIGPRCCGKTVVGKKLSQKLKLPLIDLDEEFVKEYGDIGEYVKQNGWEIFREKESGIVHEVSEKFKDKEFVMTPGGGAVSHSQGEHFRNQNKEKLRKIAKIIYLIPYENLEKNAETLTLRLKNDENERPFLTEEDDEYMEMLNIVKERDPLYKEAANEVLYTKEMSVDEVVEEIIKLL